MEGSSLQEDLARLAGVATARASEALSLLLYQDIQVKAPSVYYLSSPEILLLRLRSPRNLLTISQALYGREAAKVTMAFARESAGGLVDLLTGRRGSGTRTLGGLELDALKEAANIVNGSYLAILSQPLKLDAAPSVPIMMEGPLESLVQSLLPQPKSICVEARLSTPVRDVELLLLMAVARGAELQAPLRPRRFTGGQPGVRP